MTANDDNTKSSKGKYIGLGLGIGFAILIALIASSSLTSVEYRENIVNGTITVNAGSYSYYEFSAPRKANDVYIEGSFTANGGSGNDIIVLILDEKAFINWQNGHRVNVYYSSGKLTTDNFNVPIPSGEPFYIIYDNTFSIISDKDVATKVDLVYKK